MNECWPTQVATTATTTTTITWSLHNERSSEKKIPLKSTYRSAWICGVRDWYGYQLVRPFCLVLSSPTRYVLSICQNDLFSLSTFRRWGYFFHVHCRWRVKDQSFRFNGMSALFHGGCTRSLVCGQTISLKSTSYRVQILMSASWSELSGFELCSRKKMCTWCEYQPLAHKISWVKWIQGNDNFASSWKDDFSDQLISTTFNSNFISKISWSDLCRSVQKEPSTGRWDSNDGDDFSWWWLVEWETRETLRFVWWNLSSALISFFWSITMVWSILCLTLEDFSSSMHVEKRPRWETSHTSNVTHLIISTMWNSSTG